MKVLFILLVCISTSFALILKFQSFEFPFTYNSKIKFDQSILECKTINDPRKRALLAVCGDTSVAILENGTYYQSGDWLCNKYGLKSSSLLIPNF